MPYTNRDCADSTESEAEFRGETIVPTSSDRRRFHRFGFEAKAILRIGSHASLPCELMDLSLNGAMVKLESLPEELGESGELGLVVRGVIRGDIVTLNMDVVPVRVKNQRIGCRFVNVDAESFAQLTMLIEDNLGDVTLLDRELTQLDYWPGDVSVA